MSKHGARPGANAVDVLLLSTYDTDGAGKFAHLLSNSLQKIGYSTRLVCVRNRSGDIRTQGIIDNRPLQQGIYRIVEEFDRRVFRPRPEYSFIHMREIADRTVLASDVWPDECKLVICTFLSGMMSPSALLAILSRYGNPPLVFYGVDMNFYTAGCHYSRDCTGYLEDCSNCPAVPGFARTMVQKAFRTKHECYQRIADHVVVASSHEHHQQIAGSTLFRGADVRRILMSVDSALYGGFEEHRPELRNDYGVTGRVVLLRSSSEPRKGCDMFVDAIHALSVESQEALDGMVIVAIGDQYVASRLRNVDVRLHSPGYIDSEEELARLYTMADCFVNTSLADGGPVMLAQALMSGTPVITTDVGLARDLVCPPLNGRVLDRPSVSGLVNAIAEFCHKSDEDIQEMRKESRRLALMHLGEEGYLRALSNLVEELIGER